MKIHSNDQTCHDFNTVDLEFKEQPLNEWSHLKNNCQGMVNSGDK